MQIRISSNHELVNGFSTVQAIEFSAFSKKKGGGEEKKYNDQTNT